MNPKIMRRTFFAVVAMLGALGIAVQFWWPFQVTVAGKTWLSAHCYSSSVGWAALDLVTSDPAAQAERDAAHGRFALVLNPFSRHVSESSLSFAGVRCTAPLQGQVAPGFIIRGDLYDSECVAFNHRLRDCYAATYNDRLVRHPRFPNRLECSPIDGPRCPLVKAPWHSEPKSE